jgi:hypothetical protein
MLLQILARNSIVVSSGTSSSQRPQLRLLFTRALWIASQGSSPLCACAMSGRAVVPPDSERCSSESSYSRKGPPHTEMTSQLKTKSRSRFRFGVASQPGHRGTQKTRRRGPPVKWRYSHDSLHLLFFMPTQNVVRPGFLATCISHSSSQRLYCSAFAGSGST